MPACLIMMMLLPVLPASVCVGADQPDFREVRMGGNAAKYQGKMREAALDVLTLIPGIQGDLENRLGLKADFPVTVFIFRDSEGFSRVAGNGMIAAFVRPDVNLMALNFPAVSTHPLDLTAVLTHELTHLLLHSHIPGRNLPKWFDEGVSEWTSGGITELLHPATGEVLRKAVLGKWLIPIDRLTDEFPKDKTGLRLAYEQSSSIVTFIVSNYGEDAIRGILASLAGGVEFPDALEAELHIGTAALELAWMEELERRPKWIYFVGDNIYAIAFLLGAAATVAGFIRLRYRMKNYQDEDEEINEENTRGTDQGH